jgi:hypothetical protein
MNAQGRILEEKWIEHSGCSLAELVDWLRRHAGQAPEAVAVAIEIPRAAIVETLVEHGYAVFYINPKQLDRFRDRYSAAGAKDDSRDAYVLADSLRTDLHCFHAVRLDDPAIIRLRELSRFDDTLVVEHLRVINQFWEQLHRFFPQLLQLCSAADEPWLWDLFEKAPSPVRAAKLPAAKITRILNRHRIRRVDATQVKAILASQPLTLAPGAAEAASEHALFLLPQLRLLHQQRKKVEQLIQAVLEELATPVDGDAQKPQHRDAAIILSLARDRK